MTDEKELRRQAEAKVRAVRVSKRKVIYVADLAPMNSQLWTEHEEAVQENIRCLKEKEEKGK